MTVQRCWWNCLNVNSTADGQAFSGAYADRQSRRHYLAGDQSVIVGRYRVGRRYPHYAGVAEAFGVGQEASGAITNSTNMQRSNPLLRRLPPVRRWRWCRMRGRREFPIPGSCWCAPVSNMASKWKLFPVRRLLSRRWSTAVSPATGSVSKVSCPRKRGVRGGCSNSPMRSGR